MEYKIAYHTSKDYANLYEIISKGYRIPAWIIDDNLTKIVEVKMPCSNTGYYKIGTPGIGYEDFSNTKDIVEYKLYELKKLIFPKLEYNESLGYNSNPFIGNVYQIYRTIKHHLLKDKVDWVNVYSSPALPSGDMGTIKVTEIKE